MRNRKTILLYPAFMALFAACSHENVEIAGQEQVLLTSGVESMKVAAAGTLGTQSSSIAAGRAVSAWVETSGTGEALYKAWELTADGKDGFSYEPMFFPESGSGIDVYAIHGPSFVSGTAFPEEPVAFTVAADQSGSRDAYMGSDLLYAARQGAASGSGKIRLLFYHMLSKIEIAVIQGEGAPELAESGAVTIPEVVLDGTFLPGRISEAGMQEQSSRAAMVSTGKTSGTLTVDGRLSGASGSEVYNEAVVVPQAMGGKSICFNLSSGGTLYYTIPEGTVFESGKKYIYKITMDLSGIHVSSGIVDWAPGGEESGTATVI